MHKTESITALNLKIDAKYNGAKMIIWHANQMVFGNVDSQWTTIANILQQYNLDTYLLDRIRIFNKQSELHVWRTNKGFSSRQLNDNDNADRGLEKNQAHYFKKKEIQIMLGTSIKNEEDTQYFVLTEDRGVQFKIPKSWIPTVDETQNTSRVVNEYEYRLVLLMEAIYKTNSMGIFSLYDYRYEDIIHEHVRRTIKEIKESYYAR